MMKVFTLTLGALDTNCYIVKTANSDENNNCVIIDPAAEAEEIIKLIEKENLVPQKILLTHGHFDHTNACQALKEKYSIPTYIHSKDAGMLSDSQLSLSFYAPLQEYFPTNAEILLHDSNAIQQDDTIFIAVHTPGHTAGSVCYFTDSCIFTGDTLFAGSIGRTDCYTGNSAEMNKSLSKLMHITDDYTLYPGHGARTSLSYERTRNPYLLRL